MISDFDFVKGQIKAAYREAEDGRKPLEDALCLTAKYFYDCLACRNVYGEGLETQAVEILTFCEHLSHIEVFSLLA